ncbi:MAG: N-acetylmuramoyl-L-alanine amidase [Chitinophagaceae bacterium]|nr:N-acetylmuramoyl-L-alanine amidase [Chitinophagaceae bacterium]
MGIMILQANTCPAVLIEAGFINNEKDLAYLQTSAAKETIAKNLLLAIEKYLVNIPAVKSLTDTLPLPTKQQWDADAGKTAMETMQILLIITKCMVKLQLTKAKK